MGRVPSQVNNLARLLTYIFCHRPDEFGLVLAADGSLPVKQLLQALGAEPGWGYVRRRHLEEVANLIQPPCFAMEGDRIRCLASPAQLRRSWGEAPPPVLYLGLPPKVHARVWEEGLKAPADQELVLAVRRETALKLARRRTPAPVMVTVQAKAAAREGVVFQGYGEELFLAQEIPRKFLQLPAPPEPQQKAGQTRPVLRPPAPGAIILDLPEIFQEPIDIPLEKAARAKKFAQRQVKKGRRSTKKTPPR